MKKFLHNFAQNILFITEISMIIHWYLYVEIIYI